MHELKSREDKEKGRKEMSDLDSESLKGIMIFGLIALIITGGIFILFGVVKEVDAASDDCCKTEDVCGDECCDEEDKPYCANGECVECIDDEHCEDEDKPVCEDNECVPCEERDPDKPYYVDDECVECRNFQDCRPEKDECCSNSCEKWSRNSVECITVVKWGSGSAGNLECGPWGNLYGGTRECEQYYKREYEAKYYTGTKFYGISCKNDVCVLEEDDDGKVKERISTRKREWEEYRWSRFWGWYYYLIPITGWEDLNYSEPTVPTTTRCSDVCP